MESDDKPPSPPEVGVSSGPAAFPPTQWSLLHRASVDTPEGCAAFAELYRRYWPPIYWYARSWKHTPDKAEALTHDFFSYLMTKWSRVELDRSRGKFRSWLLQSAKNFFRNDWKTFKNESKLLVPIHCTNDDGEEGFLPLPAGEPEASDLDRAWAILLIRRSFLRLRQENSAPEKVARYRELLPYLTQRPAPATLPPIAARLSLEEGTLRQSLRRLRERFGELLREEVTQTVTRFEDVAEELRYLSSLWDGQLPSVAFPSNKPDKP